MYPYPGMPSRSARRTSAATSSSVPVCNRPQLTLPISATLSLQCCLRYFKSTPPCGRLVPQLRFFLVRAHLVPLPVSPMQGMHFPQLLHGQKEHQLECRNVPRVLLAFQRLDKSFFLRHNRGPRISLVFSVLPLLYLSPRTPVNRNRPLAFAFI